MSQSVLSEKYVGLHDAYLSVAEALRHAGYFHNTAIKIRWIDSEDLADFNIEETLSALDVFSFRGALVTVELRA